MDPPERTISTSLRQGPVLCYGEWEGTCECVCVCVGGPVSRMASSLGLGLLRGKVFQQLSGSADSVWADGFVSCSAPSRRS